MPLIFPDNFDFIAVTPSISQFDLARLIRRWKCNGATEEEVLAASGLPAPGDPHPSFQKMFVTDLALHEEGAKACVLDVTYLGALKTGGGGAPVLPPAKNEPDEQLSTAGSKRSRGGVILKELMVVSYYAPTSNRSWITYNARGSKNDIPDPTGDPVVDTVVIGDSAFAPGSIDIPTMVAAFFDTHIVATLKSAEMVAGGKYWLNQGKKTRTMIPTLINAQPGFYPAPYAIGQDYRINDQIAISHSGVCTMRVTNIWTDGGILGVDIISNTLGAATNIPINATGGHGSGAQYTVLQIS